MELFETVLLILLVLISVSLGALVLIQQSKGADIGAAFGGGAANTLFGSSGATSFVVKFTAALAIGYFLIAFGLAYTAKERADNMRGFNIEDVPELQQEGDVPLGSTEDSASDAGDEIPDIGLPSEGDDMPVLPDTTSDDTDSSGESSPLTTEEGSEIPDI